MSHDVAVIGLGAMGSAAAYHLAKRGLRVVGIDRFSPPHDRGSSHGGSRAIRHAYFEHPDYVPLVRRSVDLWQTLEAETGRELLRKTEMVLIGREDSPIVAGSLASARSHRLPHRSMTTAELRSEYPSLLTRDGDVGVHEENAGVLFPEDCVRAHLDRARELGAELRFGVTVPDLETSPAPKIVLTAGPWMGAFLPGLPLRVERQVTFWFDPASDPGRIPLFLWDYEGRPFYVIPDLRGDGFKVAFHHRGETTDPDRIRREVSSQEVEDVRRRLAETVPALNGPLRRASTCMYVVTPDEHFVIGPVPDRPEVFVASACSGHGFKFAPVVGEALADLVMEGITRHPIGLFRVDRFR